MIIFLPLKSELISRVERNSLLDFRQVYLFTIKHTTGICALSAISKALQIEESSTKQRGSSQSLS